VNTLDLALYPSGILAVATREDSSIFTWTLTAVLVLIALLFFGYRIFSRRNRVSKKILTALGEESFVQPPTAQSTYTQYGNRAAVEKEKDTRMPKSVTTPKTRKTPKTPKASKIIKIQTGPTIEGVHQTPRDPEAVTELLGRPITRVEWDRIAASGRDPKEWYLRYPTNQTLLPEGEVVGEGSHTSIRFKVGSNLTVLQRH